MGQDFSDKNQILSKEAFLKLVFEETEHLRESIKTGKIEDRNDCYGLELEGCLVDKNHDPAMENEEFLSSMGDPNVVPEIGKFNFEFNSPCYQRHPHTFSKMLEDLQRFFLHSYKVAQSLELKPIWIGTLPTIRDEHLNLQAITDRHRYHMLAQNLMDIQNGKPLKIEIDRVGSINIERDNVMTESAATSLQIHTQVRPSEAARAYNASVALSGPCMAITANCISAPGLLGFSATTCLSNSAALA